MPQTDRSTRLLLAAGISTYGDWLTVVALAVLLFTLTGRPEAPAAYIFARFAPRLFGPTIAGSLADRFGPSRVAGSAALGQGGLTAAIVVFANAGTIWTILVAVAGAGVLGRVNGVMRLVLYAGMLVGAVAAVVLVGTAGWTALVLGAAAVSILAFIPASVGYWRGAPRRPGEVTLAGTPAVRVSAQTATASRTSFSIGRPTELPHSLHDPS